MTWHVVTKLISKKMSCHRSSLSRHKILWPSSSPKGWHAIILACHDTTCRDQVHFQQEAMPSILLVTTQHVVTKFIFKKKPRFQFFLSRRNMLWPNSTPKRSHAFNSPCNDTTCRDQTNFQLEAMPSPLLDTTSSVVTSDKPLAS